MLSNREPVRVMKEEDIFQITQALPYRTSCRLNWSGVEVHRYRLQPHDAPEHSYPQLAVFLPHTVRPVKVEMRLAGSKLTAEMCEGVITIAPPGVPRTAKIQGSGEVTAIFLDPLTIAQVAKAQIEVGSLDFVPQFGIRDPLIYQIGTALDFELLSDVPAPSIYAESLSTALAAHILAKYTTKNPALARGARLGGTQLRRSIEFIHENLQADISLSEIAAVANMSKYHFAKSFRRAVGIAPHKYLVKLRIEKARDLLASGDLSIEEVANRVGYADKGHFSAQFVKVVGSTPHRYRRSI
jgi:AraC family transcriptional regulator